MAEIDITAISKLKHAELWELSKRLGSQAAAARALDVTQTEFGKWCNLQRVPPNKPYKTWTQEKILKLESKLFELTGMSMEELFPAELREATEFLNAPKVVERRKRVETQALLRYAENQQQRLTIAPTVNVDRDDVDRVLSTAMDCLTERQKLVVNLRFGLHGEKPTELKEVGDRIGVGVERVRQIENKALRKLMKQPGTHELWRNLIGDHRDDHMYCEYCEEWIDLSQVMGKPAFCPQCKMDWVVDDNVVEAKG